MMDNWYTAWQVVQARNADLVISARHARLIWQPGSRIGWLRRVALALALLGMQ